MAANHYWIHAVEGGPDPKVDSAASRYFCAARPTLVTSFTWAGTLPISWEIMSRHGNRFSTRFRVDEAYLAREHIPAQYDDNYAHNLSYLVAACAEAGRRQEAMVGPEARGAAGLPGLCRQRA